MSWPHEGKCRSVANSLLHAMLSGRMTRSQARAELAKMPQDEAAIARYWLNRWQPVQSTPQNRPLSDSGAKVGPT